VRAASPAATDYGTAPRDVVTGPRPWNCVNCGWAFRNGKLTLKSIHKTCPAHRGLPRKGEPEENPAGILL
jgi:hypothetical protein